MHITIHDHLVCKDFKIAGVSKNTAFDENDLKINEYETNDLIVQELLISCDSNGILWDKITQFFEFKKKKMIIVGDDEFTIQY